MVKEWTLESSLSPADQSNKGKGLVDKDNFTIEKLIFPSEKSWMTINIDLDAAVFIKNLIKNSADKIRLSQTECYFVLPVLRLIKASKNFSFNKKFQVSFSEIAKKIFTDSNQNSVKKIKRIIDFLSNAKFPDGKTACCYLMKSKGSSPVLAFNNSIVFDYLNKKNRDYFKISKKTMRNHLIKIIGKPKALSIFLEECFLSAKLILRCKDSDSLRRRSDSRLKEFYHTKAHHSLSEIKKTGTSYLKTTFGKNLGTIIKRTTEESLTDEEKSKYIAKVHGEIIFDCNQYIEPDFEFVNEIDDAV